mmetsp:Transcript_23292/g.66003  ORF Transcript_23292/g.66003 Transcript_23292/m.66003 type:complete len:219 (+) Transcript_23292:1267-1923(+)
MGLAIDAGTVPNNLVDVCLHGIQHGILLQKVVAEQRTESFGAVEFGALGNQVHAVLLRVRRDQVGVVAIRVAFFVLRLGMQRGGDVEFEDGMLRRILFVFEYFHHPHSRLAMGMRLQRERLHAQWFERFRCRRGCGRRRLITVGHDDGAPDSGKNADATHYVQSDLVAGVVPLSAVDGREERRRRILILAGVGPPLACREPSSAFAMLAKHLCHGALA